MPFIKCQALDGCIFNPFSNSESIRVSLNSPKCNILLQVNKCSRFIQHQNSLLCFAAFPAALVAYCLHLKTLFALRSLLLYMSLHFHLVAL